MNSVAFLFGIPGLILTVFILPLTLAGQERDASPLSTADQAKLDKEKVLVTNREYRQSFSPYIDSGLPVFITSDALLNAYHVLLEESAARLEFAQSRRLAPLLRHLWERLPKAAASVTGNPPLAKAAHRRATLVLTVAMELLGESTPRLAADLQSLVTEEVKRISAATGSGKPEWLGSPDPGFLALDYSRYMPRSFYVRSERMQRYFRAVSWLQSIPFRVEKDEEALAILMLTNALIREQPSLGRYRDWYIRPEFARFLNAWGAFLGKSDDLDVSSLVFQTWRHDPFDLSGAGIEKDLKGCQQEMLRAVRRAGAGQINDQQATAPSDPFKDPLANSAADPFASQEPQFRILTAYQLPDAVLFQRTTDLRFIKNRKFPNGMEIAASLGSEFAANWLPAHDPGILPVIEKSRPFLFPRRAPRPWTGASLYDDFLYCMAALLDAPDPAAPPFLRGEAWQRKSCGTVLASWAQMRRTFVLQAKTNVSFGGATTMLPGFVEPDPEFFQRFLELAARTLSLLNDSGALQPDTEEEIIFDLERLKAAFLEWSAHPEMEDELFGTEFDAPTRGLNRLKLIDIPEVHRPESEPPKEDEKAEERAASESKAKKERSEWETRVAKGAERVMNELKTSDGARRTAMLQKLALPDESSLHDRWMGLIRMSARIESLAQKQLRQAAFSETERDFIRNFGFTLARAMFYDSNSYESPRDDAMKVVDVFAGRDGYLHAGIGRPRAIYVLYPWQGKEILCHGTILPYHECVLPERITDAAWKTKLDAPARERPPVPEWFAPLLGEQGLWRKESD